MTRALTVAFVLTSFAASGCGADCESLCKDWVEDDCCDENDLDGVGCIEKEEDCELYCAKTEALAERADCEDELDAWNECAAGLDSVCDDNSTCVCQADDLGTDCAFSCDGGECDSETEDYLQCTTDYCSDHPDAYPCL